MPVRGELRHDLLWALIARLPIHNRETDHVGAAPLSGGKTVVEDRGQLLLPQAWKQGQRLEKVAPFGFGPARRHLIRSLFNREMRIGGLQRVPEDSPNELSGALGQNREEDLPDA